MSDALQNQNAYLDLLTNLKTLIHDSKLEAKVLLENLRTKTYWNIGEHLEKAFQEKQFTNKKDLLLQLEEDLALSSKILERSHSFYLTWPEGFSKNAEGQSLSWSHHIELLPIKNKKQREKYLRLAVNKNSPATNCAKPLPKTKLPPKN